MEAYRRDLNRWFEEPFGWVFRRPSCNGPVDAGPELDACETDNSVVVEALRTPPGARAPAV